MFETDVCNASHQGAGGKLPTLLRWVTGLATTIAAVLLAFEREGIFAPVSIEQATAHAFCGAVGLALAILALRHIGVRQSIALVAASVGAALVATAGLANGTIAGVASVGACIALGFSSAYCLTAWADDYASLCLVDGLRQTCAACFAAGLFALGATALPAPLPHLVTAAFAIVGAALATPIRRQAKASSDSPEEAQGFPRASLVASAAVLGVCLCVFSQAGTIVAARSETPAWPGFAIMAATAAVLFAASMAPLSETHEGKLAFSLFRVGVPGVFLVALFFKVIPIDAISYGLYLQVVLVCFRVCQVAAFVQCAHAMSVSGAPPATVAAPVLAATAAAALAGLLSNMLADDAHSIVLGTVTSLFLLYCAFSLGREIVLYNKPVDVGAAVEPPPDVEAVCARMGQAKGLSARESEVLVELAHGHSSGYIAQSLCISANTARTHMRNIYRKLGVESREQLIDLVQQYVRR